jgi:hypothetical protein
MLTVYGIATILKNYYRYETELPLMHKSMYPICKEFLELPPEALYHNLHM